MNAHRSYRWYRSSSLMSHFMDFSCLTIVGLNEMRHRFIMQFNGPLGDRIPIEIPVSIYLWCTLHQSSMAAIGHNHNKQQIHRWIAKDKPISDHELYWLICMLHLGKGLHQGPGNACKHYTQQVGGWTPWRGRKTAVVARTVSSWTWTCSL